MHNARTLSLLGSIVLFAATLRAQSLPTDLPHIYQEVNGVNGGNAGALQETPLDVLTQGMQPSPTPPKEDPFSSFNSFTVSKDELAHPVPGRARKEYEKGMNLFHKGHAQDAITHLKRAIEKAGEASAEYLAAQNNLGVVYLALKSPIEAMKYFQKAVRINPKFPAGYWNLAVAAIEEKDYLNAEHYSRDLLQLLPNNDSRWLLGFSLILSNQFSNEALQLLTEASRDRPEAGLMRAKIFAARGELKRAKEQVIAYLETGRPAGRQEAESWLQIIEAHMVPPVRN